MDFPLKRQTSAVSKMAVQGQYQMLMSGTHYDGGRYKCCMDALHPPGSKNLVEVSSCECLGLLNNCSPFSSLPDSIWKSAVFSCSRTTKSLLALGPTPCMPILGFHTEEPCFLSLCQIQPGHSVCTDILVFVVPSCCALLYLMSLCQTLSLRSLLSRKVNFPKSANTYLIQICALRIKRGSVYHLV